MTNERPRAERVGLISKDPELYEQSRALSLKIQKLIAEGHHDHSHVMNALLMLVGFGISQDDDPDNALHCAIQVLVANHGGVVRVEITHLRPAQPGPGEN